MRYSVWHKDTLLGTTDFGYVRCMPRQRAGWLEPTEHALAHVDVFELALRREDGTVVPTRFLAIQDTERLLALAREAEEEHDRHEAIFGEAPLDAELEAAVAHDLELLESDETDAEGWDRPQPWEPDEERDWPRFQVFAELVRDADIP